jgi:predicted RNase H-like HicB family nuclease
MSKAVIEKGGERIALPSLSAVLEKEGRWYVSQCPELGVASQGRTPKEALVMLGEAVSLWLECAGAAEIRRRLRRGAKVLPLELAHA